MFTDQVKLGDGVSADDVHDVEKSKVKGEQDGDQQGQGRHLEGSRHLQTGDTNVFRRGLCCPAVRDVGMK